MLISDGYRLHLKLVFLTVCLFIYVTSRKESIFLRFFCTTLKNKIKTNISSTRCKNTHTRTVYVYMCIVIQNPIQKVYKQDVQN